MSASLSHSIAALGPEALKIVGAACPGLEFFDVVEGKGVRVCGDAIESADAPPHAGKDITTDAREQFFLFEDHGDILLPGWDPDQHEFEIEIDGETRVLGDLDQMAAELAECLADEELDEESRNFLSTVRDAIEIARRERLPIVARW